MDINFLSPFDTVLTPNPDKDPTLCQVLGCTNHRSNAGYGRLRKVCEKHHHQQFNMDYGSKSPRSHALKQQFSEDLTQLERIAQEQGAVAVLVQIGEMRKKYERLP